MRQVEREVWGKIIQKEVDKVEKGWEKFKDERMMQLVAKIGIWQAGPIIGTS